jgi:hypothetical protein
MHQLHALYDAVQLCYTLLPLLPRKKVHPTDDISAAMYTRGLLVFNDFFFQFFSFIKLSYKDKQRKLTPCIQGK